MTIPETLRPLDLDVLERIPGGPRMRVRREKVRLWLRAHWVSILVAVAVTAIAVAVHAQGMYSSPARFDDEGTYTAYAWSVITQHRLGHYTYWYAHPPLGWMQMGLWMWVTDALDRSPYAVAAGREFMLVTKLASCLLMYGLARRLSWTRGAGAVAVLLFALSPIAAYFTRAALLDNVVTPWLLAAFFLAASPRRHLAAAAGSAACMAVAVLTKETAMLFLPALLILLWQQSDRRNRRFVGVLFFAVVALMGAAYPLYALIKNELFEGPGHVSLIWAIRWQLFGRAGSGSIFDVHSTARNVVETWLNLDPWLPRFALATAPAGLLFRRTRAVAVAFVIQVLLLLRSGYLPYPQVLAMVPFGALVVAGVGDQIWGRVQPQTWWWLRRRSAAADEPASVDSPTETTPETATDSSPETTTDSPTDSPAETAPSTGETVRLPVVEAATGPLRPITGLRSLVARFRAQVGRLWAPVRLPVLVVRRLAVIALLAWFVLVPGMHNWRPGLADLRTADRDGGKQQALDWVAARMTPDQYLIVDDSFWLDLVRRGQRPERTIWYTKLDVDPDVVLPQGWRSVRYVLIDHQDELAVHLTDSGRASPQTKGTNPTLGKAIDHSRVVASFGTGIDEISVREVDPTIKPPK